MDSILVIEDDRDIAQLLSIALAMERFMPIVAHDGSVGLREAQRLLPSLILLDLMLPTMDGKSVGGCEPMLRHAVFRSLWSLRGPKRKSGLPA